MMSQRVSITESATSSQVGNKKPSQILKRVAVNDSDDDFELPSSFAAKMRRSQKKELDVSFEILDGSFSNLLPIRDQERESKRPNQETRTQSQKVHFLSRNGDRHSTAVPATTPATSTPLPYPTNNGLGESALIFNEFRNLLNQRMVTEREQALSRHESRMHSFRGELVGMKHELSGRYRSEKEKLKKTISSLRGLMTDLGTTLAQHEQDLEDLEVWKSDVETLMGEIIQRLPRK